MGCCVWGAHPMATRRSSRLDSTGVITSIVRFGGNTPEQDPLLPEAFERNEDYSVIASPDDRRRLIIGRMGTGKSAAFRQLERDHPDDVVFVDPENLLLSYLTENEVTERIGANEELQHRYFVGLWKQVFVVEVLRHR